jgi:hypothetical protein
MNRTGRRYANNAMTGKLRERMDGGRKIENNMHPNAGLASSRKQLTASKIFARKGKAPYSSLSGFWVQVKD